MSLETRTLNQWMALWGYRWVPGREELMKGELTEGDASSILHEMERAGSVKRRG